MSDNPLPLGGRRPTPHYASVGRLASRGRYVPTQKARTRLRAFYCGSFASHFVAHRLQNSAMSADFVASAFLRALKEQVRGRSPAGVSAQAVPSGEKPTVSDSSMRMLRLNSTPVACRCQPAVLALLWPCPLVSDSRQALGVAAASGPESGQRSVAPVARRSVMQGRAVVSPPIHPAPREST